MADENGGTTTGNPQARQPWPPNLLASCYRVPGSTAPNRTYEMSLQLIHSRRYQSYLSGVKFSTIDNSRQLDASVVFYSGTDNIVLPEQESAIIENCWMDTSDSPALSYKCDARFGNDDGHGHWGTPGSFSITGSQPITNVAVICRFVPVQTLWLPILFSIGIKAFYPYTDVSVTHFAILGKNDAMGTDLPQVPAE